MHRHGEQYPLVGLAADRDRPAAGAEIASMVDDTQLTVWSAVSATNYFIFAVWYTCMVCLLIFRNIFWYMTKWISNPSNTCM
jgi:hypothetical protein